MTWQERNELVIRAGEYVAKQVKSPWERRVRARAFIACNLAQRGISADVQTIQSLTREACRVAAVNDYYQEGAR